MAYKLKGTYAPEEVKQSGEVKLKPLTVIIRKKEERLSPKE